MRPFRILIADDHHVVRQGLRGMLSSRPAWKICGEAASGRAAVAQAKRLKPALVILDVSMPELNGLEATRQILKATPKTQVLVFTMHDSEQVISAVLDAGARGFVVKSDGGKDLVAAVESMQQGKPYFNAKAADIVLKGYRGVRHRLSDREREVLQLLAEGRSNKEISTALGVSVKTVETHRANIMRKLELHSVTALVHYAMRNGIVRLC